MDVYQNLRSASRQFHKNYALRSNCEATTATSSAQYGYNDCDIVYETDYKTTYETSYKDKCDTKYENACDIVYDTKVRQNSSKRAILGFIHRWAVGKRLWIKQAGLSMQMYLKKLTSGLSTRVWTYANPPNYVCDENPRKRPFRLESLCKQDVRINTAKPNSTFHKGVRQHTAPVWLDLI